MAPESMAPSTDRVPDAAEPGPVVAGGRTGTVAAWAVFALASAVTASWATVVVQSADRGFDVTDEGFYLLSYRWWDSALRTFTGAQFVYGPVFQALGWDVHALRLFRLATVLLTHAVFGLALMRYLRLRRPAAPATIGWELAGTAVVTASGAMLYSWLPLSPGYNDLSGLGSLLVTAGALAVARDVAAGRPVRWWPPVAIGPVIAGLVLAKWASSAVTLAVVAAVVVVTLAPRGPAVTARVLLSALAGAAGTLVAVQLLLVPLTTALPQMLAATRSVAAATNNPVTLLERYGRLDGGLLRQVLAANLVLVFALALAGVARGPALRLVAAAVGAVGVAGSVQHLVRLGALTGGTGNLKTFREPMVLVVVGALVLLLAVVAGERRRPAADRSAAGRADRTERAVLAALCALPLTQALGTGNGLLPIAVCGFGAWAALVVAVATGVERAGWPAQGLAAVLVAAAVVVPAVIATTAVRSHPYRTAAPGQASASLSEIPALGSLRVSPAEAARLTGIRRRLTAYVEPPGRYVMAYDELAGVVLALGGRPVGEAWYSATDHRRTATAIAAQCPGGVGPWGGRLPLVLTVRTLQPVDRDGLAACHLELARDYRAIDLGNLVPHLVVYVPVQDDSVSGDGQ